jgi:hypothetical protein
LSVAFDGIGAAPNVDAIHSRASRAATVRPTRAPWTMKTSQVGPPEPASMIPVRRGPVKAVAMNEGSAWIEPPASSTGRGVRELGPG